MKRLHVIGLKFGRLTVKTEAPPSHARPLIDWTDISGLPYQAVHARLQKGWDADAAIFYPLRGT